MTWIQGETLTVAMPGAAAIGKDVATNRFLHIT